MLSALGSYGFGQPSFCMTFCMFRALEVCGMADKLFTLTDRRNKMLAKAGTNM